jgi:hypothetical protein
MKNSAADLTLGMMDGEHTNSSTACINIRDAILGGVDR